MSAELSHAYIRKHGSIRINGKESAAEIFEFKLATTERYSLQPTIEIVMEKNGTIELHTPELGGIYFCSVDDIGGVESLEGLLQKALDAAKVARATKQGGNFLIGTLSKSLALGLSTRSSGMFDSIFFVVNRGDGPFELMVRDKEVVMAMISVLQQKERIIASMTGDIHSVRASISKANSEGSMELGQILVVSTLENGDARLQADNVGFLVRISKQDRETVCRQLTDALQYLHYANARIDDTADRNFEVDGICGTKMVGKVVGCEGDSDRYVYTAELRCNDESRPRSISFTEKQLARLIDLIRR